MWRVAPLLGLLLVPFAANEARAEFRFDEIEPRSFEYNDEYFIHIFTYRQRVTHRWKWRDASVGYNISAGSLRTDELYLDQRAIVRLPFTNFLSGEYRFIEWEDYDARYRRNEVDVLFRLFRPDHRLPLIATLGRTPPPDGLFFGGTGVLDAEKEFDDVGLVLGYRERQFGIRLDAIAVDFFFNAKNKQNGEYTSDAYTLKVESWLDLLNDDLKLRLWFQDDLPLRLELPQVQNGLIFRYRQLRAGADIAWRASHDLRFDAELWMERTRKRRRADNDPDPHGTDKLSREALKLYVQGEWDVEPLFGEWASRDSDTVLFGVHVHLLNERTKRPLRPLERQVIRRGEAMADVGYLLALPSPDPELYHLGVRMTATIGFASIREVRLPLEHSVGEKVLAKLNVGFEASFRDDLAFGFFQFTFQLHDLEFGGGNAQVMMRF